MKYETIALQDLSVALHTASFEVSEGVREWHVILHVEPQGENFGSQLQRVYAAEDRLLTLPQFVGAQYVLKRYFLSDSANQQPLMRQESGVSISCIQQQPLDGSKIAVWLYLTSDMDVREVDGTIVATHGAYQHLWRMGMCSGEGDSAQQTTALLTAYERMLQQFDATLEANCIRTWFFVRDVDTQYAGMVRARRENFIQEGLTQHTHYLASTGIGGVPADTHALIQLGTYAVKGILPGQQHYLYAPDFLNPTYEYGVTFERGTVVEYGDRRHVIISGTASINNRGEVEHVGDIMRQTERMLRNVEALLSEGGAQWSDVAHIIVYLRDTADYQLVSEYFARRFPQMPTVITLAPVCRPTWLIEMECIAIPSQQDARYQAF